MRALEKATRLLPLHRPCQRRISLLKRSFFEQGNAQAKHALAFFAYLNDEPIAGALCFHAGANLYGRYWGTQLYSPSLHFELCYYAPIEWALNNGIDRYEAGAQGEHKIKRGFEPVACHWRITSSILG